jgi:hypothetical protein
MRYRKQIDFRIKYEFVNNLAEAKKGKGYFSHNKFGKKIYSIVISQESQNKPLAKILALEFIPEAEKIFLDFPENNEVTFEQETSNFSDHSIN